jgi:probable LLM family oxidoreductase
MELGISTFGEIPVAHITGNAVQAQRRMEELIQEAVLADEEGLDVFALGEHHRPDYLISAPEVALSAIAAVTKRIRLSSAVTVLSSADPVRVFQNFATLDLVSKGRAEIMAGRGSFIESFPLFGYDLDDYDELFIEKLDLLMQINSRERVSWKGQHRASITDLGVYPRPYQAQLPIWLAVGGTPASVVRAGSLGLPLTIAILGGQPAHFLPLVKLYRESAARAGKDVAGLQFALNQHMYIAESSEQAADEFWPIYGKLMNRVGRERGWSPMSRQQFEYLRSADGPLMVGTAQEVADKITREHSLFQNTRFLAQIIAGEELPHEKLLHSIRLFATQVAPAVRAAIN